MKKNLLILISAILVLNISANEKEAMSTSVLAGEWLQTASTAGDCEDCVLTIKLMAPHIFYLDSSNGWVGSVYYNEDGTYTGFMELTKETGNGNDWSQEIFQLNISYDGLTLTLKADSQEHNFKATFWEK